MDGCDSAPRELVHRKEVARRRFDRWAGRYERDRRSRFNAGPQREALALLELAAGDRFLDVGCGTGAAVREAAAVVERAVGADLSEKMIERARELSHGSAEFVVADSEYLPFPDGEFTAVLCTASFHHYPNPRRALAEMARVLEPGGRLAIGDGTSDLLAARIADWILRRVDRSHVRLYRTAELIELIEDAGLGGVEVRTTMSGGWAIATARR